MASGSGSIPRDLYLRIVPGRTPNRSATPAIVNSLATFTTFSPVSSELSIVATPLHIDGLPLHIDCPSRRYPLHIKTPGYQNGGVEISRGITLC